MKALFRMLCAALVWLLPLCAKAQSLPWQDTALPLEARVDDLLSRLTLDEKLSLMVHQNPEIPRVGLPAYSWWNEALHGVGRAGLAEVYPMPIAMAATFSPSLVEAAFGNIAAEAWRKHREAQDTGYGGDYGGVTFFTPNINIFRDPRWGRGMETYGECPYLTARMGLACVQGLQGGGASACLKHLAVHSGPEGVRHEFDSRVSARDLRTTYLPAFEYIIGHSRVAQVMCGYNRLNGTPCCTNRELLVDILRREWHYDGILVTDCWALNDAYELDTVIPRHRTHATAAEAYGDAFGTEVDLECGSGLPALRQAVEQGLVPESKVDEHVRRLLRVRLPIMDESRHCTRNSNPGATPLAVAERSLVLLKNNGVLPLGKGSPIAIAGPNAWDTLMPLGNYNGTPRHTVGLGEGLAGYPVLPGASTIIYCGGISPQLEGEELQVEQEGFLKGDRTRIELPRDQVADIKALKEQGNRVVLVLCTGSAMALEEVINDVDAVLVAWYGGQDMGTAVARALYGEVDCFGRLPVSFYRSTAQLPPFDDYDMTGRTYRYLPDSAALFPFGFGLGYSQYAFEGTPTVGLDHRLKGRVRLLSTTAPQAKHSTVVEAYMVSDEAPYRQLVGMATVEGEGGEFEMEIDPFWLRRFNPATARMEAPAKGSPITLRLWLGSGEEISFKFLKTNPPNTRRGRR